jgi:hypothetical protein
MPRTRRENYVSPERIRWAVNMHGHTIQRAAESMHINRRTLERWLAGEYAPKEGVTTKHLLTYLYGAKKMELEQEKEKA